MAKILVCDDDKDIVEAMRYLPDAGRIRSPEGV